MMRSLLAFGLCPLLALTVFCASMVHSVQYQCAHGLAVRSVTVEYQQRGQQVPCGVVYHKPPQAPNALWKAQAQLGFCESRAKELVQTLERSGWSCDEIQETAATEAGQVRTAEAEPLPEAEPDLQPLASLRAQAERAEAVRSGETARSERATPPLEPTKAEAAGSMWKTAPSEAVGRSGATAANLKRGRRERFGDVVFAKALARDIRKLEESTGAGVQAGNAGFGDLDGDGQPDAAVLITFDFGGTHYVQYLVAYVYRQGTYHPTARRFIGGSHREVQNGDLEAIEARMIFLHLEFRRPDDAASRPSGIQEDRFVLTDGELLRVDKKAAALATR
jgi:hypothetical protein